MHDSDCIQMRPGIYIYYDLPALPNKCQNLHDGKDVTGGPPTQKTQYSQFSHRPTRLATFANCEFFTDPQTFAELGFFYRGQGDKVSCYECGVTLSQWQKDDDPLLEHIRFSPECQHISAILDPDTLHDCKAHFQKTRADEQIWRERLRQDKITSNPGCKIRSPEYASYNVRLSTFAKFPLISGINIHHVAAAGFYYTGHHDTVRCYACDGGLKCWKPGDDPWEGHFRWFPDCLHLEQANFKSQTKQTKADEQSKYKPSRKQMKPKGSSEEFQDKSSAVDGEKAPQGGLAGTLQGLNGGETKEQSNDPQKHLSEPDLNIPAALAVLEFGYSKESVKMALNELRKNGQAQVSANDILQVLYSCEDTDANGESETNEPNSNLSVSKKIPATHISSEERLTSTKSNKNATCNKQMRRILEETDDLKSKIMCKRCKKNARSMLLLPCTHFCLCDQCSKEISLCPECWKPINERVGYNAFLLIGQAQVSANDILQVLFSCEDTDINGEREKNEPNSNLSVSKKIPATHISSEERLTSTKSNKNATCNKQLRRILEETDDLKSKMMCKRCTKNARNMLLLPCTHFCVCDQCSKEISLCPECWKPIKERVKKYIS